MSEIRLFDLFQAKYKVRPSAIHWLTQRTMTQLK